MTEALHFENEYWFPPALWHGETVFIIGGGPSLKGMDWEALHGQRIIGCNDAYRLGLIYNNQENFPLRPSSWIRIILFGDSCWFDHHREEIEPNANRFVFISMASRNPHCEAVRWMKRQPEGLTMPIDRKIGWNKSTGAGAINLALLLGARRVVLLGFDMKMGEDNQANWHVNEVNTPIPEDYIKFRTGMELIAKELPQKYPHAEVLNAGPDSALKCFPIVSLESLL